MSFRGSVGLGATRFSGVPWAKMAADAGITKDTVAAAADLAPIQGPAAATGR